MTITFPFYLRPSTPFMPVHSVAGEMVHSLIAKPLEMIRITRNYVQMAFLWPSRIRLFSIFSISHLLIFRALHSILTDLISEFKAVFSLVT